MPRGDANFAARWCRAGPLSILIFKSWQVCNWDQSLYLKWGQGQQACGFTYILLTQANFMLPGQVADVFLLTHGAKDQLRTHYVNFAMRRSTASKGASRRRETTKWDSSLSCH